MTRPPPPRKTKRIQRRPSAATATSRLASTPLGASSCSGTRAGLLVRGRSRTRTISRRSSISAQSNRSGFATATLRALRPCQAPLTFISSRMASVPSGRILQIRMVASG